MRTSLVLGLTLLVLGAGVAAQGARYVPSPVGRLMLNEVLPATLTGGIRLPLYLDKTGRYYVELYLEAPDTTPAVATGPTPLAMRFQFSRRDRILHEQNIDVTFAAGEHHQTLFWFDAPSQLPARRELVLEITLRAPPPDLADTALRLQITRKFELPPLAPP